MTSLPQTRRRQLMLALLALPAAGCAIQPLQALDARPSAPPAGPTRVRAPALGQSWTYRKFNDYNSEQIDTETATVSDVRGPIVVARKDAKGRPLPEEQYARWGDLLVDPVWDGVQRLETPLHLWSEDLLAGVTVAQNSRYTLPDGSYRYWIQAQCSARGWETVTIAGRTYTCLRIERLIRLQHPDVSRLATERSDTLWVAPEVGRWVAREISGHFALPERHAWTGREDSFRWELVDWT